MHLTGRTGSETEKKIWVDCLFEALIPETGPSVDIFDIYISTIMGDQCKNVLLALRRPEDVNNPEWKVNFRPFINDVRNYVDKLFLDCTGDIENTPPPCLFMLRPLVDKYNTEFMDQADDVQCNDKK